MAYEGPALGNRGTEADINTANQWMRSQPWYTQFLQSIGQDPRRVKLNDMQRQQLGLLMAQNGLPVPEKDEVDPAGNINPKGHKLRNFLTAAAIGGAALTGAGLAGMGPLAGLGSASTAAGGAAGAAGAGGVAGAAGATSAAAGGLLPSASIVGSAALPSAAGSSLMTASSPGLLSTVGGMASKVLGGKTGDVLGALGKGIGDATTAAGNNRISADELGIRGTANYESALNNRARTDADQRSQAAKDVYRANFFANLPSSPYNPRPLQAPGANYASTLSNLEQQGMKRLETASPYDMSTVAPLKPYAPTQPGLLEKAGNWTSPILSTLGSVGKLLRK